ncbi:MAG: hypothetical protein ACOCY8_07980 [Spirochaetota bacterium]
MPTGAGTDESEGFGWQRVLKLVAESFRMDEDETRRFTEKRVARLIAALPFLAHAENPERTAANHASTYVLSVRECAPIYFPKAQDDDDVYARLKEISRFEGGDRSIIERGMALLALLMVRDYARDVEADKKAGKHNPVASGAWDPERLTESLVQTIQKTPCAEMDEIMSPEPEPMSWWGW